uniref:Uncharacterized protein n=1 Tax=Chrysemys picta bellii TaxID=8478 RepID=A0A8C3FM06_CHRPI
LGKPCGGGCGNLLTWGTQGSRLWCCWLSRCPHTGLHSPPGPALQRYSSHSKEGLFSSSSCRAPPAPLWAKPTNVERLVQEVDVGRCVGIQITNNTRDVTLEFPRNYCFSGWCMIELVPQIPPGSSGSFLFVKTRYTARGSVGVLSYKSDAFTLAIMFSNPFDRLLYDMEFALELFTGRKHFHSMERLYHYMYS